MKCRRCSREAQVYLKSYNISLCKECFLELFKRKVLSTINKFSMFSFKDKILVAVSGGKDSLCLWDVLVDLGFNTEGLHINLEIENHSSSLEETAKKFASKNNLKLRVINIKDVLGVDIKKASRISKREPCRICGMVKRYVINKEAECFDCVVTGHNLDDESSNLLGNILQWKKGYLGRQAPLLEEYGSLRRKAKPLCFISELEILYYVSLKNIDYFPYVCPLSKGASSLFYKNIINQIEYRMPGTKLRFYKGFIEDKEVYIKKESKLELIPCQRCGYLTVNKICNFCKLKEKVEASSK